MKQIRKLTRKHILYGCIGLFILTYIGLALSILTLKVKGNKYTPKKKDCATFPPEYKIFNIEYDKNNKWKYTYNYKEFNGYLEEVCYSDNNNRLRLYINNKLSMESELENQDIIIKDCHNEPMYRLFLQQPQFIGNKLIISDYDISIAYGEVQDWFNDNIDYIYTNVMIAYIKNYENKNEKLFVEIYENNTQISDPRLISFIGLYRSIINNNKIGNCNKYYYNVSIILLMVFLIFITIILSLLSYVYYNQYISVNDISVNDMPVNIHFKTTNG